MTIKLWGVFCHGGEWEDRYDYVVKVFRTKAAAEQYARYKTTIMKRINDQSYDHITSYTVHKVTFTDR